MFIVSAILFVSIIITVFVGISGIILIIIAYIVYTIEWFKSDEIELMNNQVDQNAV